MSNNSIVAQRLWPLADCIGAILVIDALEYSIVESPAVIARVPVIARIVAIQIVMSPMIVPIRPSDPSPILEAQGGRDALHFRPDMLRSTLENINGWIRQLLGTQDVFHGVQALERSFASR